MYYFPLATRSEWIQDVKAAELRKKEYGGNVLKMYDCR